MLNFALSIVLFRTLDLFIDEINEQEMKRAYYLLVINLLLMLMILLMAGVCSLDTLTTTICLVAVYLTCAVVVSLRVAFRMTRISLRIVLRKLPSLDFKEEIYYPLVWISLFLAMFFLMIFYWPIKSFSFVQYLYSDWR